VGFGELGDVALLDRKDLNEPHAAALWDFGELEVRCPAE